MQYVASNRGSIILLIRINSYFINNIQSISQWHIQVVFFYLQIINPFSFYQIIYNNSNLYMLRKKPMKFNSIFFTLILVAITIPCTNYKSYLLSFRILYYLSGCLIDKLKPETIFKLVYLFLDCCCRATLTRFSAQFFVVFFIINNELHKQNI